MSNQKTHFTEEFKKQMVAMYNSGKSATEIVREYGMAKSTLHKWISTYAKEEIVAVLYTNRTQGNVSTPAASCDCKPAETIES